MASRTVRFALIALAGSVITLGGSLQMAHGQTQAPFGQYWWHNGIEKGGVYSILDCLQCTGPTNSAYTMHIGLEERYDVYQLNFPFAYAGKVRPSGSSDWFHYYYVITSTGAQYAELPGGASPEAFNPYRLEKELNGNAVTFSYNGVAYISIPWGLEPHFGRVVVGGRIQPTPDSSFNVSFNTDDTWFADVDQGALYWWPFSTAMWEGIVLANDPYGFNHGVHWRCMTDAQCPHRNH